MVNDTLNKVVKQALTEAMNRLSPLIVRRAGRFGKPASFVSPAVAVAAEIPNHFEDLRIFAQTWLGGQVFFATYLS